MLNSHYFKVAFLSTLIFFSTILFFLVADNNAKNMNFRNSPSIFKIDKVYSEYYVFEIWGNKFQISPTSIITNKNYKHIIQALIPKKIKLVESLIGYTYTAYNDFIQYQKNIDFLKNTSSK